MMDTVPSFRSGWSRSQVLARAKAAAWHFAICAAIAICVTLPIVFWLYPTPFFQAAGGLHLLGMILAIDVVLGPTLTFLIFDTRKASLKKDLGVIALIQVLALVYGLYATALSRPIFMTFVVDRFEMVSAASVDLEELKKAPPGFRETRWGHPQMAYAEQPTDPEERSVILFAAVKKGIDLVQMFRYYRPLEQGKPKMASRARPLAELSQFNDPKAVQDVLAKVGRDRDLGYLPMQGKRRDLTVIVDRKTGDLVEVVDLRPWR
jgi:hypothetical protein